MKQTAIHPDQLSNVPFFSQLSIDQLQRVATEAQTFRFQADEIVRAENDLAEVYWILLEGSWIMERFIDQAQPLIYQTDKPGTWHGGIAIIDAIAPPRVWTTSESLLLSVTAKRMQKWVADQLPIIEHLLNGIAGGAGLLKAHYQKQNS
ncbi:MAG: hypothetical protein AAGD05_13440 [Bacteroidota bacterium]